MTTKYSPEKALPLYVDNETVFERRGCDKCANIANKFKFHDWCAYQEEIFNARGVLLGIPEMRHCDYWLPDYSILTKEERNALEENGYEKPGLLNRIFGRKITLKQKQPDIRQISLVEICLDFEQPNHLKSDIEMIEGPDGTWAVM